MSDRRIRPPNKYGCKPTQEVCLEHDQLLVCSHVCDSGAAHSCTELRDIAFEEAAQALLADRDAMERHASAAKVRKLKHKGPPATKPEGK